MVGKLSWRWVVTALVTVTCSVLSLISWLLTPLELEALTAPPGTDTLPAMEVVLAVTLAPAVLLSPPVLTKASVAFAVKLP